MKRRRLGLAMALFVIGGAAIAPVHVLASNPCTNAVSWWTASDYSPRTITPPGGNAGTIYAKFNSVWKRADLGIDLCYVVSGTSRTAWLGVVPYNATKVKLVDQWHVDGITITVGYPSGAGFSASGSTVSWSTTVDNNWHNDHDYVDIWFRTAGVAWGWWQQATGYFTFGASSYNINAYKAK